MILFLTLLEEHGQILKCIKSQATNLISLQLCISQIYAVGLNSQGKSSKL